MSYGIKVSKPGFNVLTASDKDLYFSTEFPILKVQSQGTGSVSFTGGDGLGTTKTSTITHSLGYKPVALTYAEHNPGNTRRQILGSYYSSPTTEKVVVTMAINDTTVVLSFKSIVAVSTGTYSYYYYVFYDSAS